MQEYVRITRENGSPAFQHWVREGDRLYREHLEPEENENCLDLALNEYSRALEQEPDSALATCRMAKVFFRQGNYAKAKQAAEKSLGLADTGCPERRQIQTEAHYVLGMIQYRKGNLKQAARTLRHAARLSGIRGSRIRFGLFQACRDKAFSDGFRPAMLVSLFLAFYSLLSSLLLLPFERERISALTLAVLVPRLLLGWVQEEIGMRQAALDRYLDIHQDYPGLGSVGIMIGDMYRQKGEPEQARHWFETVAAKHPGSLDAYYHLARLLEEQEDYAGMVKVYQQLIRLKPADAHLYCNLANAHYYNQSYMDALRYYESALQLGTDAHWKAMVAQSVGNIYCDYLQNEQAAIAYYQMARALDPADIENYIQLGMLYFHKDDYGNAELIYRKAISLAPDNPRLYSNLGYLRWMEGDVETAIQHYEKSIALDPGYEIPINNLGVIYLDMLGQVHKAIELFQQAIELDEHYALAYYNLGRAYSFLDNRLEAANCFRTARELNHYSRELDNDELTARINHLFDTCEIELRD